MDIKKIEGSQQLNILFDQTCFYLRGGGQDWDTGTIKSTDDKNIFNVTEVRLDEHGLGFFRYRWGPEVSLSPDIV